MGLYLFSWLMEAAPPGVRLLLVFDRGYVRAALMQQLNRSRQPFLIRAQANVILHASVRDKPRRLSLERLPHRTGRPVRYRHVLYHGHQAEPVDVAVCLVTRHDLFLR